MEIKAFKEEQLPDLLCLQNTLAAMRRQMSAPMLREALMDSSRGEEKNVRLAYENGELAGFLAWEEDAKENLSSSLLDSSLSRIWRNQSGEALAFSRWH